MRTPMEIHLSLVCTSTWEQLTRNLPPTTTSARSRPPPRDVERSQLHVQVAQQPGLRAEGQGLDWVVRKKIKGERRDGEERERDRQAVMSSLPSTRPYIRLYM